MRISERERRPGGAGMPQGHRKETGTYLVGVLVIQEFDDGFGLLGVEGVASLERGLDQLQLLGAKFGQDGGLLGPCGVAPLLRL